MGQCFIACAYDIETKICCNVNADKFHANCYSHSAAVFSMHYLLRQKPYNIMWIGTDIFAESGIEDFSRTQDLLGLSICFNYEDFETDDLASKSYYDRVKFIDENHKLWKMIDVEGKAVKYFNWEKNRSVTYSGYLLNHTKKLAVNLANYYEHSRYYKKGIRAAIDALPVLTETGGGSAMAMLKGASFDTTENLAGTWCGDLLQIVEELPEGYEIVNCCFAELQSRGKFCYGKFGVDKDGYILGDKSGNRFKCVLFNLLGERGATVCYIKTKVHGDKIEVATERIL